MLGRHALFPSRIGRRLGALAVGIALLVPAAPATAQDPPDPTITVEPRFEHIAAHDFAPNTTLTFKAFEDGTATTEVLSETVGSDENGFAQLNVEGSADLEPGMLVRVTDGTTPKDLVIHDLVIDKVDAVNETVTGSVTAGDGTQVDVGIFPEELGQTATVTSNAWSATFTSFEWTSVADASVSDGDGDRTSVKKEPPRIEAFPQWGTVNASGFLGATSLALDIDGGTTFHTDVVSDAYGTVDFFLPEDCCGGPDVDLEPGMLVEVSDGTTTKSLVVSNLSIDRVDLELNRVTGSADPGQSVSVELHDPTIEVAPTVVVADSTGRWQVDFADITTSSSIHARVPDAENDFTGRDFNPPQIQASQDPNWWGGLQVRIGEFNPGTLMTLTILGSGGETLLSNTYNLEDGRFERNFGHLDALPGMVVRATDGVYTKELIIEPLTIENVDPTGDMVHGTATEGAIVGVNTESGQAEAETQPDGTWTADFSASGFSIETEVFASITDPDGDFVGADKFPRIVTVDMTQGDVFADQFAANSSITFEVFDQPEGSAGLVQDSGSVTSDSTGRAVFTSSVPLVGGMEVAVTDTHAERRGVLPDITIASVDPTFDTASGTADPGVEFTAGSLCGLTEQEVTRNSSDWSLDGYVFDIIHTVQICGPSPAQAGFDPRSSLSVPVLSVDPFDDLVVADGFDPAGGNITFEIYTAPGGTLLHSESVAPEDFTNENGVRFNGHAELPRTAHGEDLAPGMFVRATQGATAKEHEIAPLSVDVADPVTSDVSGTATVPTGGELIVALDLQFVLRPEVVGGTWEITEADRTFDCGEIDPCLWQLEHEAIINASVVDAEGDRTLVLQGAAEQVTCSAATSCTTDNESPADGSTELDPVETTVTSPNSGTIRIAEEQLTRQAPDTFAFLGQQVDIDAPTASPANPLQIVLRLDATRIPKGKTATDLQIYRNGDYVPDCAADSGGQASPDPCVSAREKLSDGDAQLTIRSSQASDWNAGASTDARPPTLDSASFSVNPKTQSQSTVLTATASDALSGVGGGEFFIGADPGEDQASQMLVSGSALEGTIGTLDPGTYDVGVRARDKAGNWSDVTTLVLTVEPDPAGGGGGASPSPSPSLSASPSPSPDSSPSPSPEPGGPQPCEDDPDALCVPPGDGTVEADGQTIRIDEGDGDVVVEGDDNTIVLGDGFTGTVTVIGDGNTIVGSAGDDVITVQGCDNTVEAGDGDDTVAVDCSEDPSASAQRHGTAAARPVASTNMVRGGRGDDVIRNDNRSATLFGGRGNDLLIGGPSTDLLVGGPGADVLRGGPGNDILRGGADHDILRGGAGNDVLRGGSDSDRIYGGRGDDRLVGGPAPGRNFLKGGRAFDRCCGRRNTIFHRSCNVQIIP